MNSNRVLVGTMISAVFAGIGLSFFYFALFGKVDVHIALFGFGCGLACAALSIQPQIIRSRVKGKNFINDFPKFSGIASVLNVFSIIFMLVGAVVWLIG